jgi:hypothetical protein
MAWSIIKCQYEGAGLGQNIDIRIESDDIDDAYDLIMENKHNIKEYTEHSVQDEYMYPVDHPSFDYEINSEEDVKEILNDMFNPNYALFEDGTMFWMKYHNELIEINSKS